jgi:hypothetical protein
MCRKATTWDRRLYFPSEGTRAEDFFFCPKNPTASAGCEPANLGTKGQHATSRPPEPHAWLNIKPVFLLKLPVFSCTSTAPFMRQPLHPYVLLTWVCLSCGGLVVKNYTKLRNRDVTAAGTEIERNLLEALTLARVTYTRVWARNVEGGRQYIRRDGTLSVVLGPWFLTCVRANPCDMYTSLVTLRHIHDPMLLS